MSDDPVVTTTTTTAAPSVSDLASQASGVIDDIMKFEPMIAGAVGMFVPQVARIQPWIVFIAPYLKRALDDIAAENGGDALNAMMELVQHITAGMGNSAALDPSASTTVAPVSSEPNLS